MEHNGTQVPLGATSNLERILKQKTFHSFSLTHPVSLQFQGSCDFHCVSAVSLTHSAFLHFQKAALSGSDFCIVKTALISLTHSGVSTVSVAYSSNCY